MHSLSRWTSAAVIKSHCALNHVALNITTINITIIELTARGNEHRWPPGVEMFKIFPIVDVCFHPLQFIKFIKGNCKWLLVFFIPAEDGVTWLDVFDSSASLPLTICFLMWNIASPVLCIACVAPSAYASPMQGATLDIGNTVLVCSHPCHESPTLSQPLQLVLPHFWVWV